MEIKPKNNKPIQFSSSSNVGANSTGVIFVLVTSIEIPQLELAFDVLEIVSKVIYQWFQLGFDCTVSKTDCFQDSFFFSFCGSVVQFWFPILPSNFLILNKYNN